MLLETPAAAPPSLRRVIADFGSLYAANALVAFVFAASGPIAIILAVGTRGGLSESDISSWIFGAFFVNGGKSVFTQYFPEFWLYVLGALFIAVTLFLPHGIVGLLRRAKKEERA